MSTLLELASVESGYGRVPVLRGISARVDEGEVVSLIGPNGAGKSTVLKNVLGLVPVSRGAILFEGRDLTREPTHRMPALGIGYVPQGRVVFPQMTVAENVWLGGFAFRRDQAALRARADEVYELFPRLHERRQQLAGSLSGGEQQMVAIGRSLMCRPRLLLLDEPSLGLSPAAVDLVFDTLVRLRTRKLTMLMVEQNAARALEVSDRAYVLALGRNVAEGRGATLLADPRIRELYLGGSEATHV